MGKAITQVGPIGAGHALKALNNYVSAAGMIAAIEAVHVGAAFGIDRAVIVDVMNASTGQNNTTLNKIHQYMLNDAFNSGFSLALQAKDVGIAADLGPALGLKMPLAEIVSGMTQAASEHLGSKADHTELYKMSGLKD
jgi:3-hydroxyisobutyrate dehydrogenase